MTNKQEQILIDEIIETKKRLKKAEELLSEATAIIFHLEKDSEQLNPFGILAKRFVFKSTLFKENQEFNEDLEELILNCPKQGPKWGKIAGGYIETSSKKLLDNFIDLMESTRKST